MAGLGRVKVVAIDTRTGAQKRVDEPFRDKITAHWCDHWDFERTNIYTIDAISINFTASDQVRALVEKAVGSEKVEVGGVSVCCHPSAGLKGLKCYAGVPTGYRGQYVKDMAQFICICNEEDQNLVFVDGITIKDGLPLDEHWSLSYGPLFDHDGRYLYYNMGGLGKRFDLVTHEIDTIPGADILLIPWNEEAVIVYSRGEAELELLDKRNAVAATIDWRVDGDIRTTYAVDSTKFLLGVWWVSSPAWTLGLDDDLRMAIYGIDFQTREVQRLIENADLSWQILSAELIE